MKTSTLAPVIGKIPTNGAGPESAPQMAKMPWYPRDFASATRCWPLVARGIYRELLDCQWDIGSLPNNPTDLRALAAATPAEWKIGWPHVGPKFVTGTDGRLRNPRLEIHRVKALQAYEKQRSGAAATNAKLGRRH